MNRSNRDDPEVDQLLEGGASAARYRWQDLTDRVRRTDPEAAEEWVSLQWRAVWLLLRRRLGAAATPELARAALAEAVLEVRSGRLEGPQQLITWLGGYAARQKSAFPLPRLSPAPAQIGGQISRLADALSGCEARDREALRRYYLDGQTAEQVTRDSALPRMSFVSSASASAASSPSKLRGSPPTRLAVNTLAAPEPPEKAARDEKGANELPDFPPKL